MNNTHIQHFDFFSQDPGKDMKGKPIQREYFHYEQTQKNYEITTCTCLNH